MIEKNKKILTLISLFVGQALTGSIISLLTLASVLVGNKLSPNENSISLPIMSTVLGSATMVYFASFLMKKYGRRLSFMLSSIIGMIGSLIAIVSIYNNSFYLFVFSTFILGSATVFNQYYRFAAVEIFNDELKNKKSTSIIIGAGIFGGVVGPFIATKGINIFPLYEFLGIFAISLFVFLLSFISQFFIFIPKDTNIVNNFISKKNNISFTLYSLPFVFGTLSCAFGFSLMVLIMNATPLEMTYCHFNIKEISNVLQWHFFAMYSPALLMPFFINKIKTSSLIIAGGLFFITGSLISIFYNSFYSYVFSLISIGIGWSFMFTGGTFIINKISTNEIKHKLQGLNSFITYMFNAISSFSVGILITLNNGWIIINIISLCVIIIFLIFIFLYKQKIETSS